MDLSQKYIKVAYSFNSIQCRKGQAFNSFTRRLKETEGQLLVKRCQFKGEGVAAAGDFKSGALADALKGEYLRERKMRCCRLGTDVLCFRRSRSKGRISQAEDSKTSN